MAVVITGGSRDVFIAIATAAASLTGLLFVAITVTPRPADGRPHSVIHQVRSAAALLAFTNALGVTLFSLIPGNNAGYPSAAFGIVGVLFSLASVRSILGDATARPKFLSQLTLIGGLLAVFITEIVYGVDLARNHHDQSAVDTIANVLVASMLIGVARAWEFVGDRDTGIWSSIMVLATGHERAMAVPETDDAKAGH
jgi:hypothetical protein